MDDQTPNLSLPFIMPSQAQKHVTHNEAIRQLDALVQMVAESRTITEPPASPENGAVYLVPSEAGGVWEDRANFIAVFQDGAFVYLSPKEGWRVYVKGEGLFVFDGAEWGILSGGGGADLDEIDQFGVNTNADDHNRLSVRSDGVLLTHETGDIRAVVNKQAEGNTASFLFQDNFSGRAEIGLTGSDDFRFRVSADGSEFRDSLVLDKQTGQANFPNGFSRNGVSSQTLTAAYGQVATLTGPEAVRFQLSTTRLGWQGRFITVGVGHGAHFSQSGFFNIRQPPAGTEIIGVDGTVADTVTDEGITLKTWDVLYYVLPIGSTRDSLPAHFRLVDFRLDFSFPSDEVWVFVALRNGDTGEIRLGNGEIIHSSEDFIVRG
ncbi:MAG: DUF2793 domain-containing protein [Hyphomicrobiales bacterium]